MASKINKKLIRQIFLSLFLSSSCSVMAFNPIDFVQDLANSKAGGKAIDSSEGKDIEKFKKEGLCQNSYPWDAPRIKDKEIGKHSLYICRSSFAVQFDMMAKIPLWTTEVLEKRNFEMKPFPMEGRFGPDDDLPKKIQLEPTDFIGTNYAPTQLASVYNMIINNESVLEQDLERINKKAIAETYNFTNIVPMEQGATSIWADLESQTRIWAWEKNKIYVTTGVLFLGGKTNGETKKSKAAIPTHFYKIITHPDSYGTVTFIIPNKEIVTARTKAIKDPKNAYYCNGGNCSIYNFMVNLKDLEKVSGIEYYPRLAPYYSTQVKLDINEMFKEKRNKLEKQNMH